MEFVTDNIDAECWQQYSASVPIQNIKLKNTSENLLIRKINLNGKKLEFYPPQKTTEKNIFTTIVGKNGSGKSRLLNHIVTKCILSRNNAIDHDQMDAFDLPTAVIALSTSPFDRFPISNPLSKNADSRLVESSQGYYYYFGLRGLYSSNLSMSFMVRTIAGLIRALASDAGRIKTVLDVLSYLGFNPAIKASFTCDITVPVLSQIANSENPVEVMNEFLTGQRRAGIELRRLIMRMDENAYDLKYKLADSIRYYLEEQRINYKNKNIEIMITNKGVRNDMSGSSVNDRFTPMMEAGILKLRSLELHKKSHDKPFKISDASSGEQCIVLAMLGIASQIKDGALVCIDEPEICLHPEWQERYIDLLMNTFRNFNSCHFIIATHSPQIVSRLESENCYILDMQSAVLRDAADTNRRSVDYQLANIFSAPGFKNEYLMRELLRLLSKLSEGVELSNDDYELISRIHKLENLLENSDPVRQLYYLVVAATSEVRSDG
jgi:predicted ATPase